MDFNHIAYKKQFYPISEHLMGFLKRYSRAEELPINYKDLLNFQETIPLKRDGKNTLWNSVLYPPNDVPGITKGLIQLYQMLNADGGAIDHLYVGSIDFCTYGNSKPFRIKIINEINDNHDYYYIKMPDASRVYGLELEHIFSPNKINYLYGENSLVEEHVIGIPGDQFIADYPKKIEVIDQVRLTKEFVKFNERCFVRLLGDMRSYNFVVVITQDFDKEQYRLRAMDFDQQSFEGRRHIYLPQYYKDNGLFVEMAQREMSVATANQYMNEERALLKKRLILAKTKYLDLIEVMRKDRISELQHIEQLRKELGDFYKDDRFSAATSMADILHLNIENRLNIRL